MSRCQSQALRNLKIHPPFLCLTETAQPFRTSLLLSSWASKDNSFYFSVGLLSTLHIFILLQSTLLACNHACWCVFSPRVGVHGQELWHNCSFSSPNHIRKVLHKTLSKFTSGYVYGKREWSRELTGGQDPQEENDATYSEAECLLLSQTQWFLLRGQ